MNPMMEAGLGAGGVAASGASRVGGLQDLLKPLDYPRQAMANMFRGGTGALPGILGLLGGGAAAMSGVGLPLALLAGSGLGGLLQGAGQATGSPDFDAPTGGQVASGMGLDGDNPLVGALVGAATDPLTYAGLGWGKVGTRGLPATAAAAPIPGDIAAARQVQMAGDQLLRSSSEAAMLGEAGDHFGQAQGAMQGLWDSRYPQGFMPDAIPGATGAMPSQGLPDMLKAATDPRLPFMQYSPEATAGLPTMPSLSDARVSQQAAPDVMQYLQNTMQGVQAGPGPGGKLSMLSEGLPGGMQSNPGGWASVGPGGVPPAPELMQMGQLPPGLGSQPALPSMNDVMRGNVPGQPTGIFGGALQPQDQYGLQKMLSGVGQGGAGVMDMPLDAATELLGSQQAGARQGMQQALGQIGQMSPQQLEIWKRLFPNLQPGAVPSFPSMMGAQQPAAGMGLMR